jgi:glycosyltransferase involved in cell wall biosynthesis
MRINFVLPGVNLSGGIRVLAIYAERLHLRGHQVMVVSQPKIRRRLRSKIKSLLLGRGWPTEPVMDASHFDNLTVPHRVLDTARPVVDGDLPDADIVLATFWKTGPWVAALSPAKGAKAIFLQGYETSPGHEIEEIDAVWRLPLHKIVISQWMIELSKQRFGDENVLHVPNSVDTEQFNAPPRSKQTVPTVGLLYVTLHLKGVDISIAALQQLRQRWPQLRVIAFGAQPVAPELPLPDGAEFHLRPPQSQIRDLYAACDVWMCGSRREGFHLPPLEAMACRCPVVSTRIGGPLDTIVDGVNGYLVDVDDVNGLAARTAEILALSESGWRCLSDNALATAVRYSWDDATDRLEAAMLRVIDG